MLTATWEPRSEMTEPDPSQQAVLDFLGRPKGGEPVRRIDTHAAAVFLSGGRALKIKRAVTFPFLDYSTLEKRKAACEAEIEVNRPFAPAIYRRVVPITRTGGGALAIGGDGEPVEWAVEMVRFDETQTLDHLADAGRVDDDLADALGRAVAAAHEGARASPVAGFVATLTTIVGQNDDELGAVPDLFAPDAVAALTAATRAAPAPRNPRGDPRPGPGRVGGGPRRRRRGGPPAGLVRRCHGDLHLGNIVLIDGRPTLFDAIEFDARLSTIDVFYDLAFLLMDLIGRRLQPAANIVLNRYLIETRRAEDLDALAALPLFMSVRAAIRAKVTAARRRHADNPDEAARSARDYFALARELIAPAPPRLIAVGGLSGTGKSVLARALAATIAPPPGAVVLRSDIERKKLLDAAETEKLPQEAYAREATAKVYAALIAKAGRVLASGHSAIVDAVFAHDDERRAVARAGGGAFQGLFLTADLATRVARVGARMADASDADADVARAQERYDLGALDWVAVDASGTPDDTLQRAQAALRKS